MQVKISEAKIDVSHTTASGVACEMLNIQKHTGIL